MIKPNHNQLGNARLIFSVVAAIVIVAAIIISGIYAYQKSTSSDGFEEQVEIQSMDGLGVPAPSFSPLETPETTTIEPAFSPTPDVPFSDTASPLPELE